MHDFQQLRRNVCVVALTLASLTQAGCSALTWKRDPWYPFIFDSIRISTDDSETVSSQSLLGILLIGFVCAGIGIASMLRSRKKK